MLLRGTAATPYLFELRQRSTPRQEPEEQQAPRELRPEKYRQILKEVLEKEMEGVDDPEQQSSQHEPKRYEEMTRKDLEKLAEEQHITGRSAWAGES